MPALVTPRLVLDRVTAADLDALHRIQSDPRLWADDPAGRHRERSQTDDLARAIERAWARVGLGLRREADDRGTGDELEHDLVGTCGVMPFFFGGQLLWNLGYRLAARVHGRGLGSEAAAAALAEVRDGHPDDPVIGRVHPANTASIRVLENVGLRELRRGGPAQLVLFADRELDPDAADRLHAFG